MNKEVPSELKDIAPPPRKINCPILDFHVHAFDMPETEDLVRSMDVYGIETAVAVTNPDDVPVLRERFPGRFFICLPLDFTHPAHSQAFIRSNLKAILKAPDEGGIAIKLWFQPRLMAKHRLRISDAYLQPLFDAMAEKNLLAMVHIADPDIWYVKYYSDAKVYGTKDQHYEQLETFLSGNAALTVVCAHFGGNPENLDRISHLLETYPNVRLDTSATKWITRELSRKPKASRSFFIQYADRILFGSDNFVLPQTDLRHFSLRYYVHRMFWETEAAFTSPIEDPDADGPVRLTGLKLPQDVLQKIYCENARTVLKGR